jgi:hypothetical protein
MKKLKVSGYLIFENSKETITIEKGMVAKLHAKLLEMTETEKKWSGLMSDMYEFSSSATMLKGTKVKEFYEALVGNKTIKEVQKFRYIMKPEELLSTLKKFKGNTRVAAGQRDPFKSIELIK